MKTFWKTLGIGMLVAILGSMTLGAVVSAQGEKRGSERSEEDCQAIGLRLREIVENGELTREEAGERYRAACGRVSGAEYRAIVARVEAGEMLEGLRRRMAANPPQSPHSPTR